MNDCITIRHELSSFSMTEEPQIISTKTGKGSHLDLYRKMLDIRIKVNNLFRDLQENPVTQTGLEEELPLADYIAEYCKRTGIRCIELYLFCTLPVVELSIMQ